MSLFDRVFNKAPEPDKKNQPKKREIPATAGAVPVKNAKGEITMERVKVKRYVAGKEPSFSVNDSNKSSLSIASKIQTNTSIEAETIARPVPDHGRRVIFEPTIIHINEEVNKRDAGHVKKVAEINEQAQELDTPDDFIQRRIKLKESILNQGSNVSNFSDPFVLNVPPSDESEEEDEEFEEDSTELEELALPRLKPVFVPKKERIIVPDIAELTDLKFNQEKEEVLKKRREETIELVSDMVKKEMAEKLAVDGEDDMVITEDDDEETAFEEWKIRELKRVKRDIEEVESREAEKREIERLRLMTEEERQAELAANPKIITNLAQKSDYKFLQKYFHRGAFYLDVEDQVLRQNFAEPTLEDHFDKTILPSVLQVKNFGKAGRTKYTHLVDQDTSAFDGAWSKQNEFSGVFSSKIGGGLKQKFDRPSNKRKQKDNNELN